MVYKTKTQKRNALRSIQKKAAKLFVTGPQYMNVVDAKKIGDICDKYLKKL
jgi:hypothetical protein